MAAKPIGAEIPAEPDFRTTPPVKPPWMGPLRIEKLFDEHELEPLPHPMPAQHMLADAGDDSPALMEIARLLSSVSPQAPTRIDLSGMPGPRGRGEVSRIDLPALIAAMEPQTVNRDAKRDSLATVETPSMARGIAQEGIGQALLFGYGDDIEGWLKGRHPDDIRRERLAFGDENPATALGANVAGIAAGGLGGRAVKGLIGGARAVRELDDELSPRFEPDVRQAMRNASEVEAAAKPSDDLADQLQRLLSNPEARADIQGKPLELSPADIFAMTADARTDAPAEPQPDELDMSGLGPIERMRMGLELSQAAGQNLTEEEKARNAEINRQALMEMTPIISNWMAARDAGTSAGKASAAFSRGDTRAGLMQSALAALSGFGAVTGMPTSKAAGAAAKGASSRASVFVPVEDTGKIDDVLSRRMMDQPLRDIYKDTGAFIEPGGRVMGEVRDAAMTPGMGNFKPGDRGTLGEFVDHPIFDLRPQYRDIETQFTNKIDARGGSPQFRTLPDDPDVFELSLAPGDTKQGIAKLLQYQIAKDDGLPAAMRHQTDIPGAYQGGAMAFKDVKPVSSSDIDALAAYVDHMSQLRGEYLRNAEMADPKRLKNMGQGAADRSAGNNLARIAGGRTSLDEDAMRSIYPYMRSAPYFNRSRRPPEFSDMTVLPPEGVGNEQQLMEFLRAWRQYGSGRTSD